VQVPENLVLQPREQTKRMHTMLTATFVVGGAVHGSNGEGQESDEPELHDAREDWGCR
jgi:hypothetical protein